MDQQSQILLQEVIDAANRMMWISLLVSLPTLSTALVVGVLISIVQSVTGVQEMTLTFVPKLLAVIAVLALTLSWSNAILIDYTQDIFELMARPW